MDEKKCNTTIDPAKHKYINVDSLEGLYDEEVHSILMETNARKLCFHHHFINAYLHWYKKLNNKTIVQSEWGPNKLIRYCKRCKYIDCVHHFIDEWVYHIGYEPNYTMYVVKTCNFCNKRILTSSCEVIGKRNEDLRNGKRGNDRNAILA